MSIGLIGWYPFAEKSKILLISTKPQEQGYWDDVTSYLETLDVSCFMGDFSCGLDELGTYDYIISIGGIEEAAEPVLYLNNVYNHLSDNGVVLIG